MENLKNILITIAATAVLFISGELVGGNGLPEGGLEQIGKHPTPMASVTAAPTISATPTASASPTPMASVTAAPTASATPAASAVPTAVPVEYTFTELQEVLSATSNVNVRSMPSTQGEKIGSLEKGETITVTGLCNEVFWYRVLYNNKTAYISADYLAEPTPTPIARYANSFWVMEEETVYILDSYGPKIVKEEDGIYTDILLSESVLPMDMVYIDGEFYIYDESKNELQVYGSTGEFRMAVSIPLLNDYVRWFDEDEDKAVLLTYGGSRLVFDRALGSFLTETAEAVPAAADGYDYAELVGRDSLGNQYLANTVLVKDCSVIAGEIVIYGMTPEGTSLGGWTMPMLECVYLPKRYVRVTQDGRMYVMVVTEEGFRIERAALSENPESQFSEITKKAKETEAVYVQQSKRRIRNGTTCVGVLELTRQEAYERAVYMAEYKWTLSKKNVRVSRVEDALLPRHIAAIAAENEGKSSWKVEMEGIPYCWGGFISPYRNKRNHFDTLVYEDGYLAGNINFDGYYLGGTAGVDCSGYVAAAYGFSAKESTSTLSDIGTRLSSVEELLLMDMFVAPGDHVILFCDWICPGTAMVAEASVRMGKVVVHPMSLNSLVTEGTYQMSSPW